MFNLIEGPMDEHMWALFQYTPLAPEGLFASTDFCEIRTLVVTTYTSCLSL